MDRIQELLAKGLDQLSAEELEELQTLCDQESDRLLDEMGDDPSEEQIAALEVVANALESVNGELSAREQQKAERAAKANDLRKRIKGGDEEPTDEVDDAVEADDEPDAKPAEPQPVAAEATPAPEPAPAAEVVPATHAPVVAAAPRPPVISTPLGARRPSSTRPKPRKDNGATLVASANVPGVPYGQPLESADDIADAFMRAIHSALTASSPVRIPVCGMRLGIADDRDLDHDPGRNRAKIEAVTSPQALAASGGVCAPIPNQYGMQTWGSTALPVHGALPGFTATRGGITTFEPPSLSQVSGAIGLWTMANDVTPADPTTKPYLTIPCNNTERTTSVYAVTQQVKIGNFMQKWFQENVTAVLRNVDVYAARYRESLYLKGIKDGSTVVTHGQVLGTARDVIAALRQIIATQAYRMRLDGERLRVIAPRWLRDMIVVDLIRIANDGGSFEDRARMGDAVDSLITAGLPVNLTWHLDYENGVAIGSPGGPLAGFQGAGPVIGWPSKVRLLVFLEGSWLDLQGGTWDFGIFRDQTLISTNDFMMFSEVAEAVHYDGPVGESFAYDIDICSNGLTVASDDIDVCSSGS